MRQHVEDAGLENVVVINTCAVTQEAVRGALQTIRRARRENPEARIVVTGCAAQIMPELFADLEAVDFVIGNDLKTKRETFAGLNPETEKVQVNDIMSVRETALHMIDGFGSRARAYVQIQNGCDHRCTFCIIPYGRGPSRSVPAGEVVNQIRYLVEKGYNEVVLTGVDLTSYGGDLPGDMTVGRLVKTVLQSVPELKRLRLSSIDQVEVDDTLIEIFADDERLMPHLHLSLQSGDDLILKRMKRRHTRREAVEFCERMRALRPDVTFGADLIVGFPTETDEMFENTIRLVGECGLTFLHVFPFSPRDGTPAARMPQVSRKVVKERANQLRDVGDTALRNYLVDQEGCVAEVLIERDRRGRTRNFAEIVVDEPFPAGHIIHAQVTGVENAKLKGEVVA